MNISNLLILENSALIVGFLALVAVAVFWIRSRDPKRSKLLYSIFLLLSAVVFVTLFAGNVSGWFILGITTIIFVRNNSKYKKDKK